MSGSKRRTGYRKTLQDDTLHGLPIPTASQCLAFVVRASGSNLFELRTEVGATVVALLPTKFRKLVWLKRGDFVILSAPAAGATSTARGVAGAVTHVVEAILYADAMRNLRAVGRLAEAFEGERAALLATSTGAGGEEEGEGGAGEAGEEVEEEEEEEEKEGGEAAAGTGGGGGGGGTGGGAAFWQTRHKQGPRDLPPSDDESEEGEVAGGAGGAPA
jgi:probable RNA-binding protein EIF1AD